MNEINRERFEAWLFAQPRDRKFKYGDPQDCAVCRFFKETTKLSRVSACKYGVRLDSFEYTHSYPDWLYKVVDLNCCGLTSATMQDTYRQLFPDFEPAPELAAENKPQEAQP